MTVVFWQNILSPHQSSIARALQEAGHEVHIIAETEMTADRKLMGWKTPDFGESKICVAPHKQQIKRFIQNATPNTLHIVAGARWTRLGHIATAACIKSRTRLAIMSEAADQRSWRGIGRWVKYTAERFITGRHFDFILAMGETGVRWFCACAYPRSVVFPFAYFTEAPLTSLDTQSGGKSTFEIIFIGRFTKGKGLETLLRGLAGLNDLDWNLSLVGDGPLKPRLQQIVISSGMLHRVKFHGFIGNAAVARQLGDKDLLILPSDGKEGWGAVVNEALMCGVPALSSDRCGSSDLLKQSWRGEVFRAGSIDDLRRVLRKWISRGEKSSHVAHRLRKWSEERISGRAGARYLIEIIEHIYAGAPRPTAPWRMQ